MMTILAAPVNPLLCSKANTTCRPLLWSLAHLKALIQPRHLPEPVPAFEPAQQPRPVKRPYPKPTRLGTNRVCTSLLYKKGDAAEIKKYRPISLTQCDYKIFTKAWTNRINPFASCPSPLPIRWWRYSQVASFTTSRIRHSQHRPSSCQSIHSDIVLYHDLKTPPTF